MSNEYVKPEIPQFPELTFEEERHLYYLNGLEVPSVTTLMKPLSSDFYSTVDPEVLNKAAKRGTAIHNAVENYAKFGIEDIPPVYAGYFAGFREWWDSRKPVDLLCIIDGRVTLVDYKTSAQVNSKLCAVQLEAYDRAWESHDIKVDDRLILHLSKKGYQEVCFPRSGKCWSVFSSLMTIKNYMNE